MLVPLLLALASPALTQNPAVTQNDDWRDIRSGRVIPDEGYCDQPYVVLLDDGTWLCVMTTGEGHEGQGGQHVVATRSTDHGETWSPLVDIEPADGPEASWAMPVVTPSGRVHVFYSYNGDRITGRRADMLGWYCTRHSDDGGRTWSERRRLPVRETAVDRGNDWEGKHQIFWGIGKPIVSEGAVVFGFSKIGRYMLDESEGWFFRSPNLLTETDADRVTWEMLPLGDHGLRAPEHGSIQSEQNIVALAGDDLYCMYRTVMGYPCHAYSRDGGRTWTAPEAATYSPGGTRFKHPRACPRLWRTKDGRFLLWFHNNGARDWAEGTRNPAWIVGGVERDGFVHWSQPEILLYHPDERVRMSYPDLIEQDGRIWITETQKSIARVHEIDPALLEGLWGQGTAREVTRDGLVLELSEGAATARWPELPDLDRGGGLTLELWLELEPGPAAPRAIVDATQDGIGVSIATTDDALALVANLDGEVVSMECDAGRVERGKLVHVVVIADGGPGILTWVVDGVVCDGGAERIRGWSRFRPAGVETSVLSAAIGRAGGKELHAPSCVRRLRIYDRALRTSEAIANFHAGS